MKTKAILIVSSLALTLVLTINFTILNGTQTSGISLKSIEAIALADGEGGGGTPTGCYDPKILQCGHFEAGIFVYDGGQELVCNFTGVWGAPYNCEAVSCLGVHNPRHCVKP